MLINNTLFRFLLVGCGNSLIGLALIFSFKWIGLSDVISNAAGYALGFIVSFELNKKWTFKHGGSFFSALVRFLGVTLAAYSANLCIVLFCIDVLCLNSYLAHAIGLPVYTFMCYFGCNFFVFSNEVRM